jgi:hypothetical protein
MNNDNNYTPENDIDIEGICSLLREYDDYQTEGDAKRSFGVLQTHWFIVRPLLKDG